MEWHLLSSFGSMMEQVQHRTLQFMQTEQQSHEQAEQYRSIFEATSDALTVFDLDGFIVEANPAACSVYGCTYEELVGLHGSVLTHPDNLPMMAEASPNYSSRRSVPCQGSWSTQRRHSILWRGTHYLFHVQRQAPYVGGSA